MCVLVAVREDVLPEQEDHEEELGEAQVHQGGAGHPEPGAQHLHGPVSLRRQGEPRRRRGRRQEHEQLRRRLRWSHGGRAVRQLPPPRHALQGLPGVPQLQVRAAVVGAAAGIAAAGGASTPVRRRQAAGDPEPPALACAVQGGG